MRVLIDTNILIHRESKKILNEDIGVLFYWLDKLKCEKCVHPLSIKEIENYQDIETVKTMKAKVANYIVLKTISADNTAILEIRKNDKNENDRIDSDIG